METTAASFARNPRGNRIARSVFLSETVCLLVCFSWSARAQQRVVPAEKGVAVVPAVMNFTELAQREAAAPPKKPERRVAPFMPMPPRPPVPPGVPIPARAPALAPAPLQPQALAPSPATTVNFLALDDDDMHIPPDTQGAAGPNHLMVTLNRGVRIQTRSGTALSTVSLDSFWASTGATGVTDPKLTYDPFSNRWIFAIVSNVMSAASSVLVGVTQTSDPTGNWNLYRVTADPGGVNWADYPSLGFNRNWVVVTVNMFSIASNTFQNSRIFVASKSDLYAGNITTFKPFTDPNFTEAPAVTYDNTLGTMYLVDDLNGNSSGSGFLRISTVTGTVGSEVYTAQTALASTANPWADSPPGRADFAPQQGTTQKIQNGDSRMLSVVFRNGSLWAAHNAFLPASSPTRTAAQWWQLKPDGTVQQFGRVDDPTGVLFFAFPSIAVNAQNDAVLGYSSFSGTQFASADYSVRFASDPPNTMRSDILLKAGEAIYFKTFSGTENRWGDYSNTVVDPVNDLDVWTIQEYAATHFTNGDSKWSTWWGQITLTKKRRGQLITQ